MCPMMWWGPNGGGIWSPSSGMMWVSMLISAFIGIALIVVLVALAVYLFQRSGFTRRSGPGSAPSA